MKKNILMVLVLNLISISTTFAENIAQGISSEAVSSSEVISLPLSHPIQPITADLSACPRNILFVRSLQIPDTFTSDIKSLVDSSVDQIKQVVLILETNQIYIEELVRFRTSIQELVSELPIRVSVIPRNEQPQHALKTLKENSDELANVRLYENIDSALKKLCKRK